MLSLNDSIVAFTSSYFMPSFRVAMACIHHVRMPISLMKHGNSHTISVMGALVISFGNGSNVHTVVVDSLEIYARPSLRLLYSALGQTMSLGSKPWSKSVSIRMH